MKNIILFWLICMCQNALSQSQALDSLRLVRRSYIETMKIPPQLVGMNLRIKGKLSYACQEKECFPTTSVTVSVFKEYIFLDETGTIIQVNLDNPLHKVTELRGSNFIQVNQKYRKTFLGKTTLKEDYTFDVAFRSGSLEQNNSGYPNLSPALETRIYLDPAGGTDLGRVKAVKMIQIVYTLRIDSGPVSASAPCFLLYNPFPTGTVVFYRGESFKNIGTINMSCPFISG